ncbi:uncharacterized protein RMCC_5067 [Mycolicibacterium canariasense]|uniref:Uncharacterized protein n=1 Tax=Mycolicibacterium canariasense TaxID=228230 RepID=A0A117IBL7_MYCCR|nr:hypothetical protein [Mycolicibacterium canariasense]MCV7212962.1 hypothetical protein [Mycolicibacterium canariasense]ORV10237.1 hypothetical protein AWB94_07945 [Mycolicibacterium canariasense]GAS98102.1 uncharacterized protein RMCC_5067 [Mycolicibacterium canariasense]
MKLVAEQGLWTTGRPAAAPPAVAVLEVAGAVLAWTVDDSLAPVAVTFTDVAAADWLWRVLGEAGHVSVVEALSGPPAHSAAAVDLVDVQWAAAALAPLRRLALGHWLRRWWPASVRDGIADLDAALLDVEIAVLTAAAEEFFADDTFDSDVTGLLEPHRAALAALLADGDPRVAALVASVADWVDLNEIPAQRRQQDYALAAGGVGVQRPGTIASGSASVPWSAVPPGVFDAAEDTVSWAVTAAAGAVRAEIRTELIGPSTGIPVTFDGVVGALDAQGRATLTLPISESAAWERDWSSSVIGVGGSAGPGDTREVRERLRAFARARLAGPATDAFLAEILAAESDY